MCPPSSLKKRQEIIEKVRITQKRVEHKKTSKAGKLPLMTTTFEHQKGSSVEVLGPHQGHRGHPIDKGDRGPVEKDEWHEECLLEPHDTAGTWWQ